MSPRRRWIAIGTFLVLASAFLAGVHFYLARRLVIDPGVPEPWRTALLAAIACLGATIVLQPLGERTLRRPWSKLLAWPASLWMGFLFLLLVQLLATDALLGLAGAAASAAPAGEVAPGAAPGVRAAAVAALALAAGALGLRTALAPPADRRVEIELTRWPRALDGFRIVQISDVHIGPILGRSFAEHLVLRVNRLAPDLVAITGDLVDGDAGLLAGEVAPLAGLRARHGVYFVTGNHDHYSGAREWSAAVAGLGIRVLRNERVEIRVRPEGSADSDPERSGAVFDLVGVDDHRGDVFGQGGGEDLGRALAGRDGARPAILLAHDPSTFKRASSLGIDLQLSGHTHGGQIWPFAWFVRLAVPFVAGLYRRGAATLYVSRGTGFWGPPMRLRAPAEIGEIVLRSPRGAP
jgi:predicted MPP superfamily phosphohydrolase